MNIIAIACTGIANPNSVMITLFKNEWRLKPIKCTDRPSEVKKTNC